METGATLSLEDYFPIGFSIDGSCNQKMIDISAVIVAIGATIVALSIISVAKLKNPSFECGVGTTSQMCNSY